MTDDLAKKKSSSPAKPLDPSSIPLYGRHLIEASAGTGKTFSITRIYLRLLLETNVLLGRPLRVQEILVVTFTKAATEELRGRIEKELRVALQNWNDNAQQDPFFSQLKTRAKAEHTNPCSFLESALLELDEAAVFTIHGFCHRVLSQESFASGLPMEMTMEANTDDLLSTAVQDWFRRINQSDADFDLLEHCGWQTPAAFIANFAEGIRSEQAIVCCPSQFVQEANTACVEDTASRKLQLLAELTEYEELIKTDFILKQEKYVELRQTAWNAVQRWLSEEGEQPADSEVRLVIAGTGRKTKVISELFAPVKQLVESIDSMFTAKSNQLVVAGIYWIRQRFKDLKSRNAVMDYDDLVTHLSQRLQSSDGYVLINTLREQYPVALVDEFQDTDPQQYAIFDSIYPKPDDGFDASGGHSFADGHALFMIGDPKQSIYGFRGGDIFAYLSAREHRDFGWQLTTNWRATTGVVEACNRIFWGNSLREEAADLFRYGIEYHPVLPSDQADQIQLVDHCSDRSHINMVWLPEIENPSGKRGPVKDDWLYGLARWCVSEIDRLLRHGQILSLQGKASAHKDGVAGEQASAQRPVKQQDIAVLVRTASEASVIRNCLQQAGWPSVYLSDRTPVFASDQARELLLVLRGLIETDDDSLVIAALSTRLMGGSARKLAVFQQPDGEWHWEASRAWMAELNKMWREQGCLALLLSLIQYTYQPPTRERERALTNMLQLAELLQQASKRHRRPQELLKWLRDQCQHSVSAEEAEQRLESDANLIRVITQHGAKGLEYPIVFVPFASVWRDPARSNGKKLACYKFHNPRYNQAKCHEPKYDKPKYDKPKYDEPNCQEPKWQEPQHHETESNQLIYQVGHSDAAEKLTLSEGLAESVRLLYVAVTRASLRCYIGAAPFGTGAKAIHSPLGLVLGMTDNATVDDWSRQLEFLQSTANDTIRTLKIGDDAVSASPDGALESIESNVHALSFNGIIDDSWRLTSYSALARKAKSTRLDAKEHFDDDSVSAMEGLENKRQVINGSASGDLRFTLKKGARTGDLLHEILEQVDFSEPDWLAAITSPLKKYNNQADSGIADSLANWLNECLHAPIPVNSGENDWFRLADLSTDKILREVEFYFSMEKLDKAALAKLVSRHRSGDHKFSFLGDEQNSLLSGMMHGYIDLVFEHGGQFYVCDYKSTWLGDSLADYTQQAIEQNILAHHYDLQYLIYALALHRYLQMRLGENYDPASHFGGVYYLYLRGMSPHSDAPFRGIYQRQISVDELIELDRQFGVISKAGIA